METEEKKTIKLRLKTINKKLDISKHYAELCLTDFNLHLDELDYLYEKGFELIWYKCGFIFNSYIFKRIKTTHNRELCEPLTRRK